jgi:hypothetical protein
MFTILDLHLELYDAAENLLWSFEESYDIQIKEEDLFDKQDKSWDQDIVFNLQNGDEKLVRGENKIYATLTNRTGETTLRKVRVFSVK